MTICEKVHVYKSNIITLLKQLVYEQNRIMCASFNTKGQKQIAEYFFHLKTRDAVGWEKDRHKVLIHVFKKLN